MKSPETDLDNFIKLCVIGVAICCAALTLGIVAINLAAQFPENGVTVTIIAAALLLATFSLVTTAILLLWLVVFIPINQFNKFRRDRYKLSLKQIFVLTSILALILAAVGVLLRGDIDFRGFIFVD
jgi:hypothetical protein